MAITNDLENKLPRVLWTCRRGMLELDIILQNFCEQSYSKLSSDKQQLFEELLQEEDQDLQRWLMGTEVCEKPKFQDLLLVIRHMHLMSQTLQTV